MRGEHGLVTSVEAHATRIGVQVLQHGGNAVDAAVAVGYALAVTHPSAGNLGGGGFMLVRPAQGGTVAIDFRETAPAALTAESFAAIIRSGGNTAAAAGVPGTVAGLNLAHATFGKLPLSEVLAPAIALAKHGHRIGSREALTIEWNWSRLKRDPVARKLFGTEGQPKTAGTLLQRRDLAIVLDRIARQGNRGFYEGPTAEALVRAARPSGMTLEDLRQYRAVTRQPMRLKYRGFDVEVMPPPSAGGVAVAVSLLILDRLRAYTLPADSTEQLHLFIEASRRGQAERRFAVRDPDAWSGPELAQRVERWTHTAGLLERWPPIDPNRATPSEQLHAQFAAASAELPHTTHFAVVDQGGMVVSCTTTLSAGFGAAVVAAGTGVVLNNSVAAFGTAGENLPTPGRRSTSSMAPTLVLRDGSPVLVLGSPGGDTIPSTIVQVLRNVLDYGLTIDQAVEHPRIHHGFVPDEFRYERRRPIPAPVINGLERLGHRVSKKRIPIGDANSILVLDGVAWGVADPREGGIALAAKPPR